MEPCLIRGYALSEVCLKRVSTVPTTAATTTGSTTTGARDADANASPVLGMFNFSFFSFSNSFYLQIDYEPLPYHRTTA